MAYVRLSVIYFTLSVLLVGCSANSELPNRPYVMINNHPVEVELARTEAEQTQGLSNHAPLKDNQGMLFVFNELTPRTFWMKNMNFPIDIIWIKDNTIIKISHNLPPEGDNPKNVYKSDGAINNVLEVNSGWAQKNNINIGDKIMYYYDK